MFSGYIKILNYLNEIELDCSRTLDTIFDSGEKVPQWAEKAALLTQSNERASALSRNSSSKMLGSAKNGAEVGDTWNKVIVLDPPTLTIVDTPDMM